MAEGIWKMSPDGEFELAEPYATMLQEVKIASSKAWTEAVIEYLEPRCPYSAEYLAEEVVRRNNSRPEGKMTVFEEFVLEALSGDL